MTSKITTYNVKVPDRSWYEKRTWKDVITPDDMKKVMEIVGISSFTMDGYESLIRESSAFISKIVDVAFIHMYHLRRLDLFVEDVNHSLKFHNLKFYGVGAMCKLGNLEVHPTEFLTMPLHGSACLDEDESKAGTFYEKTNLVENYLKDGPCAEDYESEYDSDDVLDSDDEEHSTTSSNLDLQSYCHHKTSDELHQETIQDLEDAQELVDNLEKEEEPLGETDDEEEEELASTCWTFTDNIYHFKGNSASSPTKGKSRMFSRKKVEYMYALVNDAMNCMVTISPAALSILHQVFEDHLYNQCVWKKSPLALEIENQVLLQRVKNQREEIEGLKSESRKRPNECLQSHFDAIDVTKSKRRVSP